MPELSLLTSLPLSMARGLVHSWSGQKILQALRELDSLTFNPIPKERGAYYTVLEEELRRR